MMHLSFPLKAAWHAIAVGAVIAVAGCGDTVTAPPSARIIPTFKPNPIVSHGGLQAALTTALSSTNGGLDFPMWATVVDREGVVVAVVFSGAAVDDQWLGSRAISAQKANTANAFSLDGFALSTANLYSPTQPGGSLYGLQESNPVDPDVVYGGKREGLRHHRRISWSGRSRVGSTSSGADSRCMIPSPARSSARSA